MDKNKRTLRLLLVLMLISVLLTGSPILLLANRIEPMVLGMPFFLFWSILPAFLLTILCIIYSVIADKAEKNAGE